MNTHDIDIELPPLPSPFGIVDTGGTEGMMHYTTKDLQDYAKAYARTAIESYIKRTTQADGEHAIKIGDVTLVAYGPQGSGKTRVLDQIQEMLTSTVQTVIEIDMPAEFRSGNDIPVTQATIKRERMEEIIRDAIAKATGEGR